MFCPMCGASNHDKAEFCVKCGARFRDYTPLETPTLDTPGFPDGPPGASLAGCTIDKYRLTKKLGQGGMGEVFLAEHVSLGAPRAVKILPRALASNNIYLARFFKEARTVAALNHPNIVQVFDAGEADGVYFFVMEYVEGDNFGDIIRREGPLHWRDAVEVARQVIEAFRAAHGMGVIHRDIKPENIMRTRGGMVKVADFGLAKNAEENTAVTRTGQVMGTPAYMSPEQCQGRSVDIRTDIYSLGATLYAILAGRPVFTGHTPMAVLHKHIYEDPEPLEIFALQVPPALAAVIHKMLAKDPAARYGDSGEILDAISTFEKHFTEPSPAAAQPIPSLTTADAKTERTREDELRRAVRSVVEKKDCVWNESERTQLMLELYEGGLAAGWKRDEIARFTEEEREKCVEAGILRTKKNNSLGMELVRIPAGEFMMGSPETSPNALRREKPAHMVAITRPFFLQSTPVTQAQWKALMGENPSRFTGGDRPVENVVWDDACLFLEKLSEKEGVKYRLPAEAEWEYACRAGSGGRYTFGDAEKELGDYAWYNRNSGGETHPVALKKNAWGLFDMHGNVWEWCADWYGENYYAESPAADPRGPEAGESRVMRGGSCVDFAWYCRSAYRYLVWPFDRAHNIFGFRVARDAD